MTDLATFRRAQRLFKTPVTWPDDVQQQYRQAERLIDAKSRIELPDDPWEAHVAAVLASETPATLDVSGLLGHAQAVREFQLRTEILDRAATVAVEDLVATLINQRDELIAGPIAQAGAKVWEEIVAVVEQLDPTDTPTVETTAEQQAAAARIDGVAAHYYALRTAVDLLHQLRGGAPLTPEHDVSGCHAEFEIGWCVIGKRAPGAAPPWPSDPTARLTWMARQGLTPWWPTLSARDRAWMATHGEQYRRQRAAARTRTMLDT